MLGRVSMGKKIAPSIGSAALPWNPGHHLVTRLFHGCLRHHATRMLPLVLPPTGAISHTAGLPDNDFGQGFYTTTLRRQAEDWAYLKHKRENAMNRGRLDFQPVVIWFDVGRDALARLETLAFVRGDFSAAEYWSFVQHCRSSVRATKTNPAVVRHHERDASGTPTWYDMVSGPVAAFWQQRSAMLEADQYSFHTQRGVDVLNNLVAVGSRGTEFDVEQVVV
jgi:hypothetical protein